MIEPRRNPRTAQLFLAAVCALVVALYLWTTSADYNCGLLPDAHEAFYNRLVEGFRAGHLSLKMEAPAGLAGLADPYDPQANYVFRLEPPYWLHDLSYYRGRLYVYFGVTPALLLYWPWWAATGRPLSDQAAAAIFCATAFLTGAALLRAAWRRYFPGVPGAFVGAGALAFGLATEMPILLQRVKVYEVAIAGGLALTLLALGALWRSLHSPRRGAAWLAAASLAYGLALGARPSLAFGAALLLVPVIAAARASRREAVRRLVAAVLPLALVAAALMAYNDLRFGSPWEFGQHFQLASDRQNEIRHFSPGNLWFNFRVYFLAPVQWFDRFPFVGKIRTPLSLPSGHAPIEDPYGLLTNVPLVWFALAVPLAWRRKGAGPPVVKSAADLTPSGPAPFSLFLLGLTLLFGISALTLLLFYGACSRYQAEFLPELMLLSLFGFLALDTAWAGLPRWRTAARCGWAVLLVASIGFTLLSAVFHYAVQRDDVGKILVQLRRPAEAIPQFERAVALKSDFIEAQVDLGNALAQTPNGLPAAIAHLQAASKLEPDNASIHFNLGNCLLQTPGRLAEAIAQYEAALKARPDDAPAHYNLGAALLNSPDRRGEALAQFKEALRLDPQSEPTRRMVERLSQ